MKWKTLPAQARKIVTNVCRIHPQNGDDYYAVGRWMIAKKLAWFLVLGATAVSLACIVAMKPAMLFGKTQGYPTYRYNSIPLKFYQGEVRILAKSGYPAYVGTVEKGCAQGKGTLYAKDGSVVYEGEFASSQYQGKGKLNYPGNLLRYEGEFEKNLFQGTGALYRENGTLEYEGEFFQGMKQGKGTLYGNTGNLVYQGSFQADEIAYEELVGKTTAQAAESYRGRRRIVSKEEEICVVMKDIGAVYWGKADADALDEAWKIAGVYVIKDWFRAGTKKIKKIAELTDYFGEIAYQGNAELSFSEAVAMNQLTDGAGGFEIPAEMKSRSLYSDVEEAESYDQTYPLYITAFHDESCQYLFFSDQRRESFSFYLIEELPQ